MKKILFISSRPIYPITGGDQIRTAQQLELLSDHFDVDVLYITSDSNMEDLKLYNKKISKVFPFYISKFKCYLNTLRFIFNRLPLQVNYYFNTNVKKFINSIEKNYDAVFCNNIRTAEYGINLKIIKLLDFVDAISMNYEKARKEASGIKKIMYTIDYKRCKSYERKCLEYFDNCAVISEVDKNFILSCQK